MPKVKVSVSGIHICPLHEKDHTPPFLICYPTPCAGTCHLSSRLLQCPINRTTTVHNQTSPDDPKMQQMLKI